MVLPNYVPSLAALCVNALAPYVDQVCALPVRLRLRSLDQLVPDHLLLDPRLWATILQVFHPPLPPAFASHTLPLLHTHQPLLQAIPSTPNFSLLTLLFLPGCVHLTDATIHHLKTLHTLCAFDASNTSLSDYAIQTLAATLFLNEDSSVRKHSGPWPLRILALRNCKQITNRVFGDLDKFPLLSVLDLRGTLCSPNAIKAFYPSSNADLYHPSSLATALATLQEIQPDIYSSSNFYFLNVTTFHPPRPTPQPSTVTQQDIFVVIPSHNSRIQVGNTVILERQTLKREDALRHEINKEAWYERQEILESRQYKLEEVKKLTAQQVKSNSLVRNRHGDESREGQDAPPLRTSLIPQVGTNSQVPSKTHIVLPNSATTSGIVQQKNRQKTVLKTLPSTHSNLTGSPARPLTDMSALLTHTRGRSQSGIPRKGFPLLRKPTFERSAVSETAPARCGRPKTALCGVSPQSLTTAAQNPNDQTAVALDPSADSTAQRPNAISSDRFYQPLPRLPQRSNRPTSVSSALRGHPSDSTKLTGSSRCKDDLLMLYRDPPGWSALNAAVTHKRSEEAASSQLRQLRPINEMAVVDMNSAKAMDLKQRLGEFIEREVTNKRQRVHNCQHESDGQSHVGGASQSALLAFAPVQPSQSRNPFKKHPVKSNDNLSSRSMGHKQSFSTLQATNAKPLVPISAIKIPVLPLVRKSALAPENAGSRGHADTNASKKSKAGNGPRIPEMPKEVQRRSSDHETIPVVKPHTAGFDWKSWSKPS